MTLRAQQTQFAGFVAVLLRQALRLGYEVTLGECWRSPAEAKRLAGTGQGIAKSLHCDRLAIDLNLFKDGTYLTTTEDYRPLGEWWERLDPICRWGGRFTRADGGHFSSARGGRA